MKLIKKKLEELEKKLNHILNKKTKFLLGIEIKNKFYLKILVVILMIMICRDNKYFNTININSSVCIYINEVNDLLDLHNSNFNCLYTKFIDLSHLNEIENYKNKIDKFILKAKNSKVENILILIGLFPFLNDNSTIYCIAKTRKSYQIIKNLLKEAINHQHKIIEFKKINLFFLSNNFNDLLNYYWKFIPSLHLLNYIRYIINNYYSQNILYKYQRTINLNLKKYISEKNSTFSYNYLKILMGK